LPSTNPDDEIPHLVTGARTERIRGFSVRWLIAGSPRLSWGHQSHEEHEGQDPQGLCGDRSSLHESGTVWHVNPPRSVILTLEDGTNQQFQIPDGQKISVNGELKEAWGLKKGMKVSATRVVETPETVVSQQTRVSGTAPQAVPSPPADEPIFFAMLVQPANPAAQATETPAELPETGTMLSLIGLRVSWQWDRL